jgi:hypothetical protein
VVFGNDPIYGQWHWVKSPPVRMKMGVNYLTFSNHSDGTALDKLIVTDDPSYYPEGLGKGITRFYDGFAGCDADNTGSWEFPTAKWRVLKSVGESAGGANDVLAQWDPEGGVALGGFPVWSNYIAEMSFMFTSPGQIGLIFFKGRDDSDWRLELMTDGEKGEARLLRRDGGREQVVRSQILENLRPDKWYRMGYDISAGQIAARLDGRRLFAAETPAFPMGQIGLYSVNQNASYFDNVEVHFLDENQVEEKYLPSGDTSGT